MQTNSIRYCTGSPVFGVESLTCCAPVGALAAVAFDTVVVFVPTATEVLLLLEDTGFCATGVPDATAGVPDAAITSDAVGTVDTGAAASVGVPPTVTEFAPIAVVGAPTDVPSAIPVLLVVFVLELPVLCVDPVPALPPILAPISMLPASLDFNTLTESLCSVVVVLSVFSSVFSSFLSPS